MVDARPSRWARLWGQERCGGKLFAGGASDEFCFARSGNRWNREFDVPCELWRVEVFLGVKGVIPSDFFASVSSHAAHDREQRAASHANAIVDRIAFSDGGGQVIVLDLVP